MGEYTRSKQLKTLDDYIQEYKRINPKIITIETQIQMLEENAIRHKLSEFDSVLQQLRYKLYLHKKELSRIILIITCAISELAPEGIGKIIYERQILGYKTKGSTHEFGMTEGTAAEYITDVLKTPITDKLVNECGKILEGQG